MQVTKCASFIAFFPLAIVLAAVNYSLVGSSRLRRHKEKERAPAKKRKRERKKAPIASSLSFLSLEQSSRSRRLPQEKAMHEQKFLYIERRSFFRIFGAEALVIIYSGLNKLWAQDPRGFFQASAPLDSMKHVKNWNPNPATISRYLKAFKSMMKLLKTLSSNSKHVKEVIHLSPLLRAQFPLTQTFLAKTKSCKGWK